MASRLGWEPETTLDSILKYAVTLSVLQEERVIEIDFRFRSHGASVAGRLKRVEIQSERETGEDAVFTVSRSADELEAAGHDRLYESVVEMAGREL